MLRITGRVDDLIATPSGASIAPSEIEAELKFSPFIADALVVGGPNGGLGALIAIERGALSHSTEEERKTLVAELDHIEESLNTLRMPLAYADAFYVLREHIGFVRARLTRAARATNRTGSPHADETHA